MGIEATKQHVPPGTQDFSREFFIEKFITVNAQGNLSEGPGGGKGYEDRFAVLNLTALRVVWETGSSIHREPRKNITVFHQEILLQKKVRNSNTPKGREGVRGTKTASRSSTLRLCAVEGTGGSPYLEYNIPQLPLIIVKTL